MLLAVACGYIFCVPLALSAGVSAWTPVPTGNCVIITFTLGNMGCHLPVVLTLAFLVAKAVSQILTGQYFLAL